MSTMAPIDSVRSRFDKIASELDERGRRIWAAAEAKHYGRGGVAIVNKGTGIARSTIRRGIVELDQHVTFDQSGGRQERRIRKCGAGRKKLECKDSGLTEALNLLVEPTSRGDPMSPLRWTCKSTRNLAEELTRQGYKVSHAKVGKLLGCMGFSLQSTNKRLEGGNHPDRDAQFRYIAEKVKQFHESGQPVISVDTKKKELVGTYANKGREFQPKGKPVPVNVYDFINEDLGKAIPYGVYDCGENKAWVNVGIDHDTAEFAVQSIRQWWIQMGKETYSTATSLLITADGGGSNGSRCKLWKWEIQKLSNELGVDIHICHFPPGTSKWNKIEHRLFSRITQNWRGRPLETVETIVSLIGSVTSKTGLEVKAGLDMRKYETKRIVTPAMMSAINIQRDEFHGHDWNYSIMPVKNRKQKSQK